MEARSTADLHHPNVVSILDEGNEQGIHYIVMELAEGMTLKRYIRRYGRLSVRETVDFSIQIASGIQAAHEHGIVHRDIKPQNIIVSDSGKIKVNRFWHRESGDGRYHCLQHHGFRALSVAGTGKGRLFRCQERHLLSRYHHVRDGDRKGSV